MTAELIVGPRFTGTDQAEGAEDSGGAAELTLTMKSTTTPIGTPTFTRHPLTKRITVSAVKGFDLLLADL